MSATVGPPSLAATMMARESFEKSWPRFLSVAPFLCLMEAHLEWPDIEILRSDSAATVAATRSQKARCRRSSSVSSGWNVATMIVP